MKVYYTRTQYSPWTIHDLFNELSIYLNTKYKCSIHTQVGGHVYIPEINYYIGDCELVIYDEINDNLKIISYSETKTSLIDILKQRNKLGDILIILHNLSWKDHITEIGNFKIQNTTFYPFSPKLNYNYFYNLRQLKKHFELIDKIFFRTTTGRGDEIKLSTLGLTNELFDPLPFENYLELAINYKVGLSIPTSNYELCHRDFDYMAIGLPLMRLELMGTYNPQIIPNFHYIAVSRDNLSYDNYLDLKGGDNYIDAYRNRFLEIKNDTEFLHFIQQNAKEYYDTYCSPTNKLKLILNKLEII